MSLWFLVQVLLNLLFLAGIGAAWVRLKRPPSEDPRLSRGLQLLQSKIAILEDLGDRTDTQVQQLSALLENKCVEIQAKITEAEKILRTIETSRQKSLETAKMFEDKIPHQEIVERQNTAKYVKAARLAHQGVPLQEILMQVDISQAEAEFIAKVNKNQLMFSEENLPSWAQDQGETAPVENTMSEQALRRLGAEFERAVAMAQKTNDLSSPTAMDFEMNKQSFVEIQIDPAPAAKVIVMPTQTGVTPRGKTVEIKPFQFPRIEK